MTGPSVATSLIDVLYWFPILFWFLIDLFIVEILTLLSSVSELTHLDLSGAYHKEGMGDFRWLLGLPKLVSLTLHNVQGNP